jgi:DNA-binding NtrC family response regulator
MTARLILINNDHLMRQVVSICLNDAGWNVLSYDYDHIDFSSVKQLNPALIILNISHTEAGAGWQLLQRLKVDDTTVHIPILIMTNGTSLSLDMQSYLLKRYIQIVYQPFDLDTFLKCVQQTVRLANQSNLIASRDRTLPILLVDDAEDLREGLATVLKLEGYHVVTADNGLMALNAVDKAEHCLIVLDIAMPVMDGLEFLEIYNRQLRPHTSVIVLSGKLDIQKIVFPSFVVDVVSKPFEVHHMIGLAKKYTQAVSESARAI